ncbi:hypothetical protein [Aliikangiella sp. IMCC44359]|uniref:hypothetical protein n=1 Tax=Aliikangiella sp. IMCC44359 TaxID=3459125 RepID=UPI00403B1035
MSQDQDKVTMELGGSQDYAFLSPLASWSIMVEFVDETGLLVDDRELSRRRDIQSFSFQFKGIAQSRYLAD